LLRLNLSLTNAQRLSRDRLNKTHNPLGRPQGNPRMNTNGHDTNRDGPRFPVVAGSGDPATEADRTAGKIAWHFRLPCVYSYIYLARCGKRRGSSARNLSGEPIAPARIDPPPLRSSMALDSRFVSNLSRTIPRRWSRPALRPGQAVVVYLRAAAPLRAAGRAGEGWAAAA
jgi:hypothetical protein